MEIWELPEGAVTVQEEGHIVHFRVDCVPPCEPTRLLRCYGEGAPKDLLVGVLEPKNGRLVLDRRVSRETLRQAGAGSQPPERYYLSDGGAREREVEEPPVDIVLPGEVLSPVPESPAEAVEPAPKDKTCADTASVDTVPEIEVCEETVSADGVPAEESAPSGTGDALLDAVLARGEAHCEKSPEGFRITCPFSPGQPFALAFVALLCRAEHGLAVLEWTPPQEPV